MVVVVFFNIKIYRALIFVSVTGIKNLVDQVDLFDDVPGSVRLDRRWQYVELLHIFVVTIDVILHNLHGFELLNPCFFAHFILAFVGIIFQMPDIGNIAHIAHFVANVLQVAEYQVEGDGRPRMTQMGIAIHRRAANVKPDVRRMNGFKFFLFARKRVVKRENLLHDVIIFEQK